MRSLTLLTPHEQKRLWLQLTDDEADAEVRDEAGVRLASLWLEHDQPDMAAVLLESIAQHRQSAWSVRAQFSLAELLQAWGRANEADRGFAGVASALQEVFVPDVALNLAARAAASGDDLVAKRWYAQVLRQGASEERALAAYRLAHMYVGAGDRSQAVALLRACVSEADEDLLPHAAFELAEMWGEDTNPTIRCALLERVLHTDHPDLAPLAALMLGDAAWRRDDHLRAQHYYDLCVWSEHPQHAATAHARRRAVLRERLRATIATLNDAPQPKTEARVARAHAKHTRTKLAIEVAESSDLLLLYLNSLSRSVYVEFFGQICDKTESWWRARRWKRQAAAWTRLLSPQCLVLGDAVRKKPALTEVFAMLVTYPEHDHISGLSSVLSLQTPAVGLLCSVGSMRTQIYLDASAIEASLLWIPHFHPASFMDPAGQPCEVECPSEAEGLLHRPAGMSLFDYSTASCRSAEVPSPLGRDLRPPCTSPLPRRPDEAAGPVLAGHRDN